MFTTLIEKYLVRPGSKIAGTIRTYGATALAALFALTLTDDARASGYAKWKGRVVVDAALKSGVPPELALAVARAGVRLGWSRFNDRFGVMGISPEVALAEFGVRAQDLRSPNANAGLGVALLERLYRRYGERWDLALSHYRGGQLQRCESGPVVHEHTLVYVAEVMEWWRRHQKDEKVAAFIRNVRNYGTGTSRFSEAENLFSREDQGRVVRFDPWYDTGMRSGSVPCGEGRYRCGTGRFF